jgi:translation initiation factor IF-3
MSLWYTRTKGLNPDIIGFFLSAYKERAITKKGTPSEYRINDQIRVPKVRLIDGNGKNVGVVSLREAQDMAYDADLDLVEVAPTADPPVCKIMDFGKFQYEQAKKEREARKQQKTVEVKEIRLRPKTTEHHRSFKVRDARRWLEDGMKVRVRIRFRGREITYPEIGLEALDEIAAELDDVAVIEQRPGMEGRTMLMVLAPKQAR